jgi:hypothetical protein
MTEDQKGSWAVVGAIILLLALGWWFDNHICVDLRQDYNDPKSAFPR